MIEDSRRWRRWSRTPLQEIPGIGEAIVEIIKAMHRTGTHPSLEKMRKEFPFGVLDMLRVPGLRPAKARFPAL